MADIKITLSQNKKIYTGDITEEIECLKKRGELWYPLSKGKPQRVEKGDWVYFILNGEMVGRAKIRQLEEPEKKTLKTCRDKDIEKDKWGIRIKKIIYEPAKTVPHTGFTGFRYLTLDDKDQFEKEF